ncbi:MAG: DUF305 domain-containing protein [Devosia sp.]
MGAVFIVAFVSLVGTATLVQGAAAGRSLPAICTSGSMPGMAAPMSAMPPGNLDQAHAAMMKGMDQMDANMAQAMTAADIDVAFVCGMIPHHQGAIDMAEAILKYGKDPFTQKLATGIVAAQEHEIADMLDWLKTKSK